MGTFIAKPVNIPHCLVSVNCSNLLREKSVATFHLGYELGVQAMCVVDLALGDNLD